MTTEFMCMTMKSDKKKSKGNKQTNTKRNRNKVPSTVFSFYVNLYCSRKSSTNAKYHSNVAEATKSWLSLSESEKQQVDTKFRECKEKYKLQIFNQLKNAEPFLKTKHSSLRNLQSATKDSQTKTCEIEIDCASQIEEDQIEPIENVEKLNCANALQVPTSIESPTKSEDGQIENGIETSDREHRSPSPILIEPIPPSVKSGHELFCMLASIDEETNNATWASLSRIEKHQYSRAVSTMKKDYIYKYKEYLECLTSKQLFDHYNKTISS